MSNENTTNKISSNGNVSFIDMEALRDQICGICTNLNMVRIGLDSNGFPEYAQALEPALLSLNDAQNKANTFMEMLMSKS